MRSQNLETFAGDDGAVDRTDRSADDPVRLDSGFVQRLINATLVRAERAPALKHQYHLTWKRWGCLRAISHDVHPSSRVPPEGA